MLTCYRYIELDQVRATMVVRLDEYCWSSYAPNAADVHDARITPHATYRRLGATDLQLQAAYIALAAGGLDDEQTRALAANTQQRKPWDRSGFDVRSRH